MPGVLRSIAAAKKELSTTRVREIYNNIRTREYRSSTIVTEEKKASYDAALGKKLNPKEGKYLNDLTPYVNGTVVLSYLNAKRAELPRPEEMDRCARGNKECNENERKGSSTLSCN